MEEQTKQVIRDILSVIDERVRDIESTPCLWFWTIWNYTWQIRKKLKEFKCISEKNKGSIFTEMKGWLIFFIPFWVFPLDVIAYIFLLHSFIVASFTVSVTKTVETTVEVTWYWIWKMPKKVIETVIIQQPPSPLLSWSITIGICFILYSIITYIIKWYLIWDCRWLLRRLSNRFL
ncbi:MAG: hypothetical protein HUU50_22415 [Candidatus Brocadiae bacterium]|nr:hypothetical protein [Candidatus Brocadiia bacterium]